jgi:N-acetylmuramoyl-L-alanine amidase
VDAGHGGSDPGKVGINQVLEKDVNLEIAKQLETLLEGEGFTVVMTRTEDVGLYSAGDVNKKTADLKKRCDIILQSQADIAVSIHQNSYTSDNATGAQVFYYKDSSQAKALALNIQEKLITQVDPENKRSAKENGDYYMLLHSNCPAVIVECGFLSNFTEAEKLNTQDYQKQVAEAIKDGIVAYFNS